MITKNKVISFVKSKLLCYPLIHLLDLANVITIIGILCSLYAVCISQSDLNTALVLITISTSLDSLDGYVARKISNIGRPIRNRTNTRKSPGNLTFT